MLYDMESTLKETLQDGSLSRRVEEMSRKGIAASSALLPLGGLGAGIIAKAIWERKNIRKGDDVENTLTNKIIRKAPIAGFATGVVASPFYRHIAKSMIKRGSLNRDVSLRPHQVDAIKFLQERGRGIVAHGTGLGKTLTSIAAFENMREKGDANKAIVVVPAALRENYAKNISDFTDSDYSIYGAKGESGTSYYDQPSDAPYNIMSYEMYKKDPEGIRERLGADTLIIDEAHRARNDTSVTYKDLSANTDKYKHIIALTGSLVNNEPSDIAPLLHVAFGDEDAAIADRKMFDKLFVRKDVKVKGWFNPVTEVTPSIINKQDLARHLSDKVHYVSHEAMKDSLPEKEEEVVKVQMTPEQKRLYLWSLNALDPITRLKIKNNIPVSQREMTGIFAQMMQGRKLMTDQSVMDDSLIDKNPYEYSPKIKKIVDDLGEHLEESDDNKAVVYGNLIHHQLNAVQKGLEHKGIPYTTYYGVGNEGNSSKARSGNVKEYMDGKKRVLLISGAGGEGLDLKGSTMLQMVEGHYNPEKIQQAEARVRRMGDMRGKPIKVKRYVSTLPPSLLEKGLSLFGRKPSTSIDEYIYNVAERKNKLNAEFRDVLSKRASADAHASNIDSGEIAAGAALAGGGLYAADNSLPAILGKKKLYHGTSKDAWKKIRKDGLDPAFGGGSHGASASIKNQRFLDSSKGFVHAAPQRNVALGFANLSGSKKESPVQYALGMLGIKTSPKGKVISMYRDYDEIGKTPGFVKSIYDDMKGKPLPKLVDKAWELDPDMPMAVRTKTKITPDSFGIKGLVKGIRNTPKYIRKHPGRFGLGVVAAAGGTAAAYAGARKIIGSAKPRNDDALNKKANIIGWTVGNSVSDLINRAIDKRESTGIDASIKQRLINEQASEYLLPKHYNAIKRKSGADERQKLIEAGSWLLSAGVAPYAASLLQRVPVMERMVAKTNSPGIPIALTALTTLGLGLATTQGPKRLLRARLMRSDDVPRAIEQHTKDLNRKAERKIIAAEKYIDQAERIERLGLEKRMLEL